MGLSPLSRWLSGSTAALSPRFFACRYGLLPCLNGLSLVSGLFPVFDLLGFVDLGPPLWVLMAPCSPLPLAAWPSPQVSLPLFSLSPVPTGCLGRAVAWCGRGGGLGVGPPSNAAPSPHQHSPRGAPSPDQYGFPLLRLPSLFSFCLPPFLLPARPPPSFPPSLSSLFPHLDPGPSAGGGRAGGRAGRQAGRRRRPPKGEVAAAGSVGGQQQGGRPSWGIEAGG